MKNNLISINSTDLTVKEFHGQRVVTLREVDAVHQRPEGTARKRFNDNREHFIEGTDFFTITQPSEIRTLGFERPQGGIPEKVTLITESGYLMLVKSFTDDLAWDVQRQLVNTYFRAKEVKTSMEDLSPELKMFKVLFDTMARAELQQKAQEKALENVSQRVDGIREVVALRPTQWREDCRRLLAKIAVERGGGGAYQEVNTEAFDALEERAKAALDIRLTNKRRRMADEGVCKSRRDKLTKVDVIADDPKLIEIYISIVKEMSVKYGIAFDGDMRSVERSDPERAS